MNKKTTYELTIADKLQQLPLPDMEDAIWSRIKTQLDVDLPGGDGSGSTPQSPSGGWMGGAGLTAFVAAVIAVFILTQRKEDQQSFPVTNKQKTESKTTRSQTSASPPPTIPQHRQETRFPSQNATGNVPPEKRGDSVVQVPPLTVQPISDPEQPTLALVPPPPVQDSTVKSKAKGRGVQNITDADYRIVPVKKDST